MRILAAHHNNPRNPYLQKYASSKEALGRSHVQFAALFSTVCNFKYPQRKVLAVLVVVLCVGLYLLLGGFQLLQHVAQKRLQIPARVGRRF